jgi:hypothetical protein
VARYTTALARNLARQGRRTEALRLGRESLAQIEAAFGRANFRYADGLTDLAVLHALLGEWDAAAATMRAAIDHEGTRRSPPGVQADRHGKLGQYLIGAGRLAEAETELLRSLELVRRQYPDDDHLNVDKTKRTLHRLYTTWGRPLDAERYRVPPPLLGEPEW